MDGNNAVASFKVIRFRSAKVGGGKLVDPPPAGLFFSPIRCRTELLIGTKDKKQESVMGRVASILAVLVLSSSFITGCGCLAADSYEKSACQKYYTDWPLNYYDND